MFQSASICIIKMIRNNSCAIITNYINLITRFIHRIIIHDPKILLLKFLFLFMLQNEGKKTGVENRIYASTTFRNTCSRFLQARDKRIREREKEKGQRQRDKQPFKHFIEIVLCNYEKAVNRGYLCIAKRTSKTEPRTWLPNNRVVQTRSSVWNILRIAKMGTMVPRRCKQTLPLRLILQSRVHGIVHDV